MSSWLRTIFKIGLFFGTFCMVFDHASAETATDWYAPLNQLNTLFSNAAPFAKMGDSLAYFTLIFTAIGYAAVMIVAVRRVSKAKSGEESMGWVASTMITVALMATAPAIGTNLFNACDELADKSPFSQQSTVTACWNALLVILPGSDSPIMDVLQDAQKPPVAPPASAKNDDAPFTKLAWTWMKMAWASMTDALDKITAAFRTVINHIVIIVLLFIPTITLVTGMITVELGLLIRVILRECMEIFLPMMLAFLAFAPMRGAATNFIIKYISIAFWPVAWALGNAIAGSLLASVMNWVINVCTAVAATLPSATAATSSVAGPATAGLLVATADFLPWSSLIVIVVVVSIASAMVLVSAIGAPIALTSLITSGTTFVGEQLGQTMRMLTGGSLSGSVAASNQTASSSPGFLAGTFSQMKGLMGSAAAKMSGTPSVAMPVRNMAALAASFLEHPANALGSAIDPKDSQELGVTPRAFSSVRSMMETVPAHMISAPQAIASKKILPSIVALRRLA